MSAVFQAGRSQSRLSYTSKQGGGSRNSDEDGKSAVSVKVGMQLLITGRVVQQMYANTPLS